MEVIVNMKNRVGLNLTPPLHPRVTFTVFSENIFSRERVMRWFL